MGTSAPMRREYDIPIIEPYRPLAVPKSLPQPNPERWIPVTPAVRPVRQPERVEV